ncbi:DUF3800 domain-containing protein [Curtobacterium sp. Curtsp57]|uniref:DUF3800 domain-containing protein n=1 Tax=Curtobacterium sp. Curtsp57 TaxID=3243047 RepID=UPI0039B6C73E
MMTNAPIVVACDESGNDGENLLDGSSPIFAHASLTLSDSDAADIMIEVRARTRSQSAELKSKTIVQPKHEATARWLLQHPLLESGASVHLTHKRYFLVAKLFDSTVEEMAHAEGYDMYADGSALSAANILHFLAPSAYAEKWDEILLAFQNFLRAKTAGEATFTLERLDAAFVKALFIETPMRDFIELAYAGISHLGSLSALQLGHGIDHRLRTLDPLIPAVGATVRLWAKASGKPVEILHDAAKELSPERIAAIRDDLAKPERVSPREAGTGVELTSVVLVDSQHDERVQVADLVAGIARVVAQRVAAGEDHPLFDEIKPLISQDSIWPNEALMNPEEARRVATRS